MCDYVRNMYAYCRRCGWRAQSIALVCLLLLFYLTPLRAQQTPETWKQTVQQQVRTRNLDAAQQVVDRRIAEAPRDLEAHGWRARLLAWRGQWHDAESEYRYVLGQAPDDTDILTGLADVLTWEQRSEEALHVLDHARALQPTQIDILIRHARLLAVLGQTRDARSEYRRILTLDPSNSQARSGLDGLAELTTHELRFGADLDAFNYTGPAQTYAIDLRSRWTTRWSTLFSTAFYQRFRESAAKFSASTAYRFTANDWLNVGGAVAYDNAIIPRSEGFFEYGHGFRFSGPLIRGLESSYQQHWLWFRDARVMTLNSSQLVYLPRSWTWTLSVTGARSGFSGTTSAWRPSGMVKLGFPLRRRLSGNTFFAVGSENFALADQVGSFSARTSGGGLRYHFAGNQDISAYLAYQDRSTGRTQTSFGVNYGFRF